MSASARTNGRRARNRDILVSIRVCIVAALALAACDDDTPDPSQCATGGACKDGETCAGFESDFVCVDGTWKCVPSGRVGDPCVAEPQDAGIDVPAD